jgi:hypothetical protein
MRVNWHLNPPCTIMANLARNQGILVTGSSSWALALDQQHRLRHKKNKKSENQMIEKSNR